MRLSMRLAVLGWFLAASPVFSQTTYATITGHVTDPNGLAIPGLEIAVRNEATGFVSKTKTNDVGIYTVSQLLPGPYTLKARHEGFKEFVGNKIELLSPVIKTVDIRMEVGTVSATIEVSMIAAKVLNKSDSPSRHPQNASSPAVRPRFD